MPEWTIIGGGENAFPPEYSISGWFRWGGPYTVEWHLIFRLSIVQRTENQNSGRLGDRTLTAWANRA